MKGRKEPRLACGSEADVGEGSLWEEDKGTSPPEQKRWLW